MGWGGEGDGEIAREVEIDDDREQKGSQPADGLSKGRPR